MVNTPSPGSLPQHGESTVLGSSAHSREEDFRPIVDVSGGDLHTQADDSWAAVTAANDTTDPEVLVRGSELVFIAVDDETDAALLRPFTKPTLRDRLSEIARFGNRDQDGEWTFRKPPVDIADVLLARDAARYTGAPRVNRVVDVPVFGRDATLITTPGYHPGSRTYYRPTRDMAAVPTVATPESEEVEIAVALLRDELFADFPFVDHADLANAIGLVVLPFARELIDGPTPMHAIMAHEPGTGKSLLAEVALIPSCGRVPRAAEPGDPNEWRKVITAQLLQGPSAIVFDNLRQKLDSGPLANALTSTRWTDRILGHSKLADVPIRNAWVATVNNLDLNTEQARRIVPIFLDAQAEEPWRRDGFRHPDLIAWARANRHRLAWAALTLIRNWLDGVEQVVADGAGGFDYVRTGRRFPPGRMLGSYESWSTVVGGILAAAGIPGHLENAAKLYGSADDDRNETAAFIAAWGALGTGPVQLRDLVALVDVGGPLQLELPAELREVRPEQLNAKMRVFLRSNNGRIFDGLRLTHTTNTRRKEWYVEKVGDRATTATT